MAELGDGVLLKATTVWPSIASHLASEAALLGSGCLCFHSLTSVST